MFRKILIKCVQNESIKKPFFFKVAVAVALPFDPAINVWLKIFFLLILKMV